MTYFNELAAEIEAAGNLVNVIKLMHIMEKLENTTKLSNSLPVLQEMFRDMDKNDPIELEGFIKEVLGHASELVEGLDKNFDERLRLAGSMQDAVMMAIDKVVQKFGTDVNIIQYAEEFMIDVGSIVDPWSHCETMFNVLTELETFLIMGDIYTSHRVITKPKKPGKKGKSSVVNFPVTRH